MFNSTAPSPFIHCRSRHPSILCLCLPNPIVLDLFTRSPESQDRSISPSTYLSIYLFITAPAICRRRLHILFQRVDRETIWPNRLYKLQWLVGITQRIIHANLCEFSVNVSDLYLGRITTYYLRCKFYILRAIQRNN